MDCSLFKILLNVNLVLSTEGETPTLCLDSSCNKARDIPLRLYVNKLCSSVLVCPNRTIFLIRDLSFSPNLSVPISVSDLSCVFQQVLIPSTTNHFGDAYNNLTFILISLLKHFSYLTKMGYFCPPQNFLLWF